MTNKVYPKYKEACFLGTYNLSTLPVKVALVDTNVYTYSDAHQFLSSLTGIVGTPQTLGTKTFTDGTFKAANATFPLVAGAQSEALVYYGDTGTAGTSPLLAFIDTAQGGMPITPNGTNIPLNFHVTGIFSL